MLGYDLDPGARANPTYVYVAKDPAMPLSPKPYAAKKFADVDGRRMAYIDEGAGAGDRLPARQPHLVLPLAQRHAPLRRPRPARRLRPDRHGRQRQALPSGPDRYTYAEQRDYLFALWDKLDLGDKIVLVLHDWGSALGFEWARRNASRVAGLVYMEAIVTPLTWADWPENARAARSRASARPAART